MSRHVLKTLIKLASYSAGKTIEELQKQLEKEQILNDQVTRTDY